jgi:hypothetical protein
MTAIPAPPNDYDKYGVFIREPEEDTESWPDGHGRIIGPFDTWQEAANCAWLEERGAPDGTYVRWAPMRRPGPEDVPPVRLVEPYP